MAAEQEEKGEVKVYELGFLVLPTLAEEELGGAVSALKGRFEKHGGVFLAEGFPERISLSYRISKTIEGKHTPFSSAYFGWLKYELPAHASVDLGQELKKEASLLRFLLIETIRETPLRERRAFFAKPEVARTIEKPLVRKSEKPAMSEEELDRTIQELVIE